MTAPTYRLFAHHGARRLGPLRWSWEVTDGIGGPLLAHGYRLTQRGAEKVAAKHAATCERWEDAQLAAIVARLHDDGIDVEARYDDRRRVCVRPTCACSDVDHRRVMLAFVSVVGPVRWEVAR